MPSTVLDYASKNSHEKSFNELLQMHKRDKQHGLHGVGPIKAFKHRYEVAVVGFLETEVRVLATTLK
jgi:hypothetical protein